MQDERLSIGIVGGSGALGGAIARGLLRADAIPPNRLWISNRSGDASGLTGLEGIRFTTRNQELADASDVIVLVVPPQFASEIGIAAPERLIVSVMAGVAIERIRSLTRGGRIVRAMSSPAAAEGLAYSPWCAGADVSAADRRLVRTLFEACGLTDEVPDEDQIDLFTALTGPVPGFVAYFAECMVEHAVRRGVSERVADRAVRQLFHASGIALKTSEATPAGQVRAMIDYAGTTAAGLEAMRSSPLAELIGAALDAASEKARSLR